MMYLYNKLTTDFSVNGQPIRNAYDAYVVRGEGFQLRFNLLLDENEEYKLIKKEMIISAMTPDGENYFRVWDIVLHSTHVEIIALQLMYDFDNKLVKSFAVNRATGQTVINVFKNNFKSSLGNFTISSSVQEVHDFTLDDMNDAYNALEVLQRIAVRWDSELSVDGYDIRMIKRLGKRTNALLHENKNISEFEDTSTTRGLATRIYAKSTFRASDGDEEDTIIEVTVDSPLINEYSQIYEKHYTNNDARTEQELINWVNLKYSTDNMDKPKRTIESATHIIDGTEINYGDDLVLKYHSHDVDEVIRCVGYEYDPLTETFYGITLGGFRQSYTDAISNRVVDLTESINLALRERMNQIANEVQIVTATANGLNRETWGPNPVPNPREGDKWFYFTLDRPNEVEFRQYDGTKWVTLMDDYYGERVKKRIEEIREEAEKLADDITNAQQSADDAKRDAGLALTASETLEIITQETASQLSDTRGLLATVESNASEAWAKADSAVTQAGQAITDAYTAQTTAQSAISQAQSALSKANSVEETTNSLVLDVDNLAGEVSLKADSSTVNTLKGTVDSHSTEISANTTSITSKADKSVVDTLSGTVSNQGTMLTQQASQIASKANQSEVDTVKGTVSDHTSTLSQHATAINARLTQSQVDSLVSGKGYSTVSYVDNKMSATAEGITNEMTRIEGKIPTEIGGRNLLIGSKDYSGSWTNKGRWTVTSDTNKGTLIASRTGAWYGIGQVFNVFKGEQYTFSAYVKATTNRVHVYLTNHSGSADITPPFKSITVEPNTWTYLVTVFSVSSDGLMFPRFELDSDGETIYISSMKLEKGNVATDWSPAPEDMLQQNDFIAYKNTIESSLSGITTELSKTAKTTDLQGMVTETYLATNQYTKQGEINTQLQSYLKSTDLDGKLQTTSSFQNVKATTDRFTRVIGSTDAQAKTNIAQIAMSDSMFQTTVRKSINADSNNLIKNGNFQNGTESWEIRNASGSVVRKNNHGKTGMHLYGVPTASYQGIAQSINPLSLEKGSQVTVGFDATRDSVGGDLLIIVHWMVDGAISGQSVHVFNTDNFTSRSYQRESVTLNVPIKCNSIRVMFYMKDVGKYYNIYLTDITVSRGNVDLGYSPHIDDKASSKSVSDIKQTADSIQALVGTTNESVARAVMTSNLWETEVSKVVSGELKQDYKTVTSRINNVTKNQEADFGMSASGYNYYNFELENDIPSGTKINVKFFLNISNNQGQQFKLDYISSTGSAENILSMNLTRGQNNVTTSFVASKDYSSNGAKLRLKMYNYSNYVVYFEVWHMKDHQVPIDGSNTGAISSKITQLYDMINLSVLGKEGALSRIAMGEEGIQLKSDLIHLDGKVKMTEAFAQKLFAEEVSADTVTAFSAKFANVIANNIDVNNIAGNKASFIQLLLNGTNTALRVTSSVVDIMRNDGSISTRLTQNGMEIWRDGSKVGAFESRSSISESGALANKKSISMTPERDSHISLGYYKAGETISTRVLSVAGDTGRIYIGSALYPSEYSTYGLQIQRYTLNSSDGIRVGSTGGSSGIFFGDFGHVSIQFNGIWYAMNRLIN